MKTSSENAQGKKFGRGFRVDTDVMKDLTDVIAATFFDIYNDGILVGLQLSLCHKRSHYSAYA